LVSVNGQPLTEMGKAVFNITLCNLTLDSELIVAEIEDEALLGLENRGLSPITLDESSTSCFVLSGSEPNLLNRGQLPITLDESSTSCFVFKLLKERLMICSK
jgi:hypothetical protein